MTQLFRKIDPFEIKDNVFKAIGNDSFLITAGKKGRFNMMTASWGGWGYLWKMPVVFCFIRPQRHTFRFMEENDGFTISFFDDKYKNILSTCGSVSGKVVDKMQITGLLPLETESGNIYFEQARLVLECHKLYANYIKPEKFTDLQISAEIYPGRDFHKLYIASVVQCLSAE